LSYNTQFYLHFDFYKLKIQAFSANNYYTWHQNRLFLRKKHNCLPISKIVRKQHSFYIFTNVKAIVSSGESYAFTM